MLKEAALAIRQGQFVVYPTDTVYGIACDATREDLVGRLIELKKREKKDISVLVADFEMLEKYSVTNKKQKEILKKYLPGPFTFILESKNLASNLSGTKNVGFRITKNETAQELCRLAGVPITATSANLSGKPTPPMVEEIEKIFGKKVAVYVDGGILKGEPSTVVDLTVSPPLVLRKGAGLFLG